MADKIEMSLDELIKSNKPSRGGEGDRKRGAKRDQPQQRRNFRSSRGSGGVQKGRGREGIARSYRQADLYSSCKNDISGRLGSRQMSGARTIIEASMGPTKMVVSNLDFEVSDSDMRDLFGEFGPLKSVAVIYDRSGRSLGRANIIFERKSDAIRAMKQYNGVPLDGKAMNIQLATPEIPSPSRRTSGVGVGSKFQDRSSRGAGRARNTKGRPAERGHNQRKQRKPLTAEELDAELEDYRSKRNQINEIN